MEPLLAAVHAHRPHDVYVHVQAHTLSPESKPGSPSGDSKPKLRIVERGSQACNECRRHKIRCHPAPDDPEHIRPCARCVRMMLECVFKKHNRGRKRKNPPANDAHELPLAPAKQPHHDGNGSAISPGGRHAPPPSGFWNRGGSPDRPVFNNVSRYPFMGGALEQPRDEPEHPSSAGNGPAHPSHSRPGLPASMSLRSMVNSEPWDEEEEYTDSDEPAEHDPNPNKRDILVQQQQQQQQQQQPYHHRSIPQTSAVPPSPPVMNDSQSSGDPVSLGYVTLEEAKVLFNLYMKHFNIVMPFLDPPKYTHDFVRHHSPFLYTVICEYHHKLKYPTSVAPKDKDEVLAGVCIASRYMSALGHEPMPLSANSAHQQIVILARDHLMWAFAEAVSTIEVVQAIAILSLWKEPDDDKAAFYFNRAVVLARELDLGREPPASEVARMSPSEQRELRGRQRLWFALFSANSIFHMQFRQPMLIAHTDPLIANSTLWLRHALPDQVLMDTFAASNVDLRRRFLNYRQLLTEGQPSALTLSVITNTMNKEWEVTSDAWTREIMDAGGTSTYIHKPRVWYSSLALNLNLIILNQTLRISPSERVPPASSIHGRGSAAQLRSIPAFHYCLNAASSVLMRFHDLDKSQLTYASDTLLHFALYAATFLWSLCRTPDLYDFGPAEVEYTRDIILKVADTLDSASVYPGSSPGLHAKHLRRLCRSGGSGSDAASSGSDSQQFGHGRNQSYSETERTPIDLPRSPMGNSAHGVPLGLGSGRSNSPGHLGHGGPPGELDYLLSDFQWAGIDLPWGALEPAHIMGAAGGPPPPPPRRAPSPRPLTTPTNGRYPGHHAGNVA